MTESKKLSRIAWPMRKGHVFSDVSEVTYCKAEGSYTYINLSSGAILLISQKLKIVESLLPGLPFMRVHPSYLVNLEYAQGLLREDGGFFLQINGSDIPVAKTRRKAVLEAFHGV